MYTLNPKETSFDFQNALSLAYFSALSYDSELHIRADLAPHYEQMTHLFYDEGGFDTQVYVASNTAVSVVFFTGTESDEDWVTNLDTRSKEALMGKVHRGFWEALDHVWEALVMHLTSLGKPIFLTGHSQGGALAMMAARRLYNKGLTCQGVYTFGQPKVGDLLFASSYDSLLKERTFRIYHAEDRITSLPSDLYHAGVGVRVGQGALEIQEDHNILETSGGGLANLLDSMLDYATDELKYHQMETYIQSLMDIIS